MIKEGRYAETMEYFKNSSELAKVGGRISPARVNIINELPKPEEYDLLADSVAKNSWDKEEGRIEFSGIRYFTTGPDGLTRKQNQALPLQLQREISLIYM